MHHSVTVIPTLKARFPFGSVGSTPGALASTTSEYRLTCLSRHLSGDWGCVCDEDRTANDRAVTQRVLGLELAFFQPLEVAAGLAILAD